MRPSASAVRTAQHLGHTFAGVDQIDVETWSLAASQDQAIAVGRNFADHQLAAQVTFVPGRYNLKYSRLGGEHRPDIFAVVPQAPTGTGRPWIDSQLG